LRADPERAKEKEGEAINANISIVSSALTGALLPFGEKRGERRRKEGRET